MRTTSTRLGVSLCHLLFGTSAKSMKLDAKATERALNELNVSRLPNTPVPLEFALGEGLCVGSQSSSASSPMSAASSAAPTRLDPLESSDTPLLDVPSGSGSPLGQVDRCHRCEASPFGCHRGRAAKCCRCASGLMVHVD